MVLIIITLDNLNLSTFLSIIDQVYWSNIKNNQEQARTRALKAIL